MATNLVQDADGTIQVVATGTYVSGTPVLIGTAFFGVPQAAAVSGGQVAFGVSGVYSLPKTGGVAAFALGARCYWSGSVITSTVTDSLIGVCSKAALIADTTIDVLLNGGSVEGFDAGGIAFSKMQAKALAVLPDSSAVITAAQVVGGLSQCTPTGPLSKATDTAANILALLVGHADGTSCNFTIANLSAAQVITVTAGVGVTIVGVATIAGVTSATWTIVRTSASTIGMVRN